MTPDRMNLGPGLWADLCQRYTTPPRAYHGPQHLQEVLDHWAQVDLAGLWTERENTFAALCLHDAVYKAGAGDNERRSAELAGEWCPRFCQDAEAVRVGELIELTAKHGKLEGLDLDPQAALFLDCDMAILGSQPERYASYEAQIQEEFSAVPRLLFRYGRRRFLKKLLESPIYHSPYFSERLEARARQNIHRALGG